jgi:hypothetical protein
MNPNVILILVVIFGGVAGLAVWCGPKGCRWLAQILLARAAGLDAYSTAYRKVMSSHISLLAPETWKPEGDGLYVSASSISSGNVITTAEYR